MGIPATRTLIHYLHKRYNYLMWGTGSAIECSQQHQKLGVANTGTWYGRPEQIEMAGLAK